MPRKTRQAPPSRLVPQRPVKKSASQLLLRKRRNIYRRTRGGRPKRSWLRLAVLTSGVLGLAGVCLGL